MTCAKKQVTAVIIGKSGQHYVGYNACRIPQQVCPRDPGEGYEKCQSVCRQHSHAEIAALKLAGDDARGGSCTVVGHSYVCTTCSAALIDAGVIPVTVVP